MIAIDQAERLVLIYPPSIKWRTEELGLGLLYNLQQH
jgi:hypothetical protein